MTRPNLLAAVYFNSSQLREMAEYVAALYDLIGGAVKVEPGETGWYVGIKD